MTEENKKNDETKNIKVKKDIFKGVQFCLCEDVDSIEEVKKVLVEGGGKHVNYLSDIATHLIADNPDHQDVSEAVEIYEKPVVSSRWVWLSAISNCLLPTSGFSPFKNRLMSNVVACPSNISLKDAESLWAMITFYGGSFKINLDSECTHLVSTKPEGNKYEKAISSSVRIKIVSPDWVVDSVKNQTLCDEELYHPKLLILPNSAPPRFESSLPTDIKSEIPTTIEIPTTTTNTPTTQVTLRTVSLPSSTIITSVPVSGTSQISAQQKRQIRLLLPPNSQETSDFAAQQHGIQPRQVYLTLQQQPQIRQQQFNFIQIRQQQIPRAQGDVQVPVKPIILQQRIQPPVQLLPQQQQSQVQIQLHPQQQSSQQVHQQQQSPNQGPNQLQPGVQPMINVFRQSSPSLVPKMNQSQTLQEMPQPSQIRLAQGQQLIQVQRQMSPMHQRAQIHNQGNTQQIMRMPHQPNQFPISQSINQDQIIQGIQQQQTPVRMVSNQQLIHLQKPEQQQINNNISSNNQQIIRASSSQLVFHQQNATMQVSSHQKTNLPSTIQNQSQMYNTQGQQFTIGPPQVQRVPQLRMQPNISPIQRGQFKGQISGQQNVATGKPRAFMKPTLQYQFIQQQQQQQQQQQIQSQQSPQSPTSAQSQSQQQGLSLHNENQMIINQANIIRGQKSPSWGQQWIGPNESGQQQNHTQSPVDRSHQLVVSKPAAVDQQQLIYWQQQQQPEKNRKSLPEQQPSIRMIQTSPQQQQQFAFPNQASDQVRSTTTSATVEASQQNKPHCLTNSSPQGLNTAQQTQSFSVNTCLSSTTCISTLVTPKTKTTLANFLNTRLQNNTASGLTGNRISNDCQTVNLSQSTSQSFGTDGDGTFITSVSNCSPSMVTSFSIIPNKIGFVGSPGVVLPNNEFIHSRLNLEPQLIQERYFNHEPRSNVPAESCLIGCVFYLIEYEKGAFIINPKQKEICRKVIQKYGGELEDTYSIRCTHVICETQLHATVQQALKENKRCVTIFWLNDVIAEKKMKPPNKIWHIPRIFDNDSKPCKEQIITVTNFKDTERLLLREIIKVTGAKYTNYMTQKNTVLICKTLEGKKFMKATEWGLNIVNVFWIHDVLFGPPNQALINMQSSQRYKKFDQIDCFALDYNLLKPWMVAWKVPIKIPDDFPKRVLNSKEEAFKDLNFDLDSSKTSALKKSNDSQKKIAATKSVESADQSCTVKKETETDEPLAKKSKLTPFFENVNNESNIEELPPLPPLIPAPFISLPKPENVQINIMFSGIKNTETLKEMAIKLGAKIVTNYTECTHLIMDQLVRTVKFMCAFSTVTYILHPDWIYDSSKCNQFINENSYFLQDVKNEQILGFNLKESLMKRKLRDEPLFKNFIFYITKSVIPSYKVLLQIATSAGGQVAKKSPSPKQLAAIRKHPSSLTFVVITKEDDLHICDFFFEKDVAVLNSEFILSNLLRQEIDFESYSYKKF